MGVETGDSFSECLVIVVFPDGIEVEVTYPPDARMVDLLPLIATTHRIKLYRSEYVFVMSETDQERLMLQTPFVNLHTRVDDVGARTFQLQKKLYADSIKTDSNKARQRKATQSGRIGSTGGFGKDANDVVITDATANAYQVCFLNAYCMVLESLLYTSVP